MFDRIPVKITFNDENINKMEVLDKFRNETIFYPKEIHLDYFSTIMSVLLEEKDPLLVINNFVPSVNGQMYLEIGVRSENTAKNANCLEIVYNNETDFQESVSYLVCNVKKRKSSMSDGFFDKILSLRNWSKDIADLNFIERNYKDALVEYGKLFNRYPELSRRMCEICRMILGSKSVLDPIAVDILIFYERYDELFNLAKDLVPEIRIPIFMYLSKSDLTFKKRLITSFCCYENFKSVNEIDKSKKCLHWVENMLVECGLDDPDNKPFLEDIKSMIIPQ